MKNIGIIGAGIAGLHLGLQLRQHGIPVTIYTNRTAEDVRDGRVMNSVSHMPGTQDLETDLGVNHWTEDKYMYYGHEHYVGGEHPLRFPGTFERPARVLDYRIYIPQLMDDFEERGGVFEYRDLSVSDIERLTDVHDLVVVSTGKGEISALFPKRLDKSPYDRPQRKLAVGFWHGVRRYEPNLVEMSLVPGVGELLAIPMWSFEGPVMALLFESVPGGEQEALTDQRFEEDPAAYRQLTLDMLERFHPGVFARVDHDEFRIQGPKDILQGAITPVLREDYVRLSNGRFLLALGDVHMALDPVVAQGANATAQSARVVGDAILEDDVYDQRFVDKVVRRRSERIEATNDWVNTMIQVPPKPQLIQLLGAMSANRTLADEFTTNFADPIRQMDMLASEARAAAAIERAAAHEASLEPATALA